MSEDRTQEPSKRRRQEARDRGQVARSGELTTAAGLLAIVVSLGIWGDEMATGLLDVMKQPFMNASIVSVDASNVVEQVRQTVGRVLGPLAAILATSFIACVAANQLQVGGLWAPSLLAPDLNRLWSGGLFSGISQRAGRGCWSLIKVVLLVALAFFLVRSEQAEFQSLLSQGSEQLSKSSAALLKGLVQTLAIALLVLGVIDFALQWRQFEERLRMTPDEHREELRALDGDPALRSRRRRLVELRKHDPSELLTGATLLLTAPGGLAVLLGGGPPPRKITVRQAARGVSASLLRRAAEQNGIPLIEAPEIARFLTRRKSTGGSLPAELSDELAMIWPRSS